MLARPFLIGVLLLVVLCGCSRSSKNNDSAAATETTTASGSTKTTTSRPSGSSSSTTSVPTGDTSGTSGGNASGSSSTTTSPPIFGNTKHCTVSASWKPRNGFGGTSVHIQVTSDQKNRTLTWTVRQAKKINFIGGSGRTSATGTFAADGAVGGSATNLTGDAVVTVIIDGPYACSIPTRVP